MGQEARAIVRAAGACLPAGGLASEDLGDLRFRALMTEAQWAALPLPIRRRFSKQLAAGETIIYVGEVLGTRMTSAGRLLAEAARLIGSPFPRIKGPGTACVVAVTEDRATGGQNWTRLYVRRHGFPQIIHSRKRFAGPTGLEECIGFRIGMALTITVSDEALVFRSAGYFVTLFGRRLPLPAWATPGSLTVTHMEAGDGRFIFTLDVVHPMFGALISQKAVFREAAPDLGG
ncbi:MAG: DUF4166 domain-containing protein [Methylobacteriaceae bacterium]|nr:DUF4166 domain-containing protein [Methylobacteriaceae bacterium]